MKIKINKNMLTEITQDQLKKREEEKNASVNFVKDMTTSFDSIKDIKYANFRKHVDAYYDTLSNDEKIKIDKRFILKTGYALYSREQTIFDPKTAQVSLNQNAKGPPLNNFAQYKEEAKTQNAEQQKLIDANTVGKLVPMNLNNGIFWSIIDPIDRNGYYYYDPSTPSTIYFTRKIEDNKNKAIIPVTININLSPYLTNGETKLYNSNNQEFTTSLIDKSKISMSVLIQVLNEFYTALPAAVNKYRSEVGIDPKASEPEKPEAKEPSTEEPSTEEPAAEEPAAEEPAAEEAYNIRKPSRDDFIDSYQDKLTYFARKHRIAQDIIDQVRGEEKSLENLTDGEYGRRTHLVTRKAVESYLEAVRRAIKQIKDKAVKENRIESLAKLLNQKLNKSKKNWLFESEESDKLNLKALEGLETTLEEILNELNEAHNNDDWRVRANPDAEVKKSTLEKFAGLMEKAKFDNEGNINNLEDMARGGSPEQPPDDKKPETPKENPQEVNDQLRDASCWYTFNITIRGQGATSPDIIWAAAGLNFDSWYKNINKILTLTNLPTNFNYTTGILSGYSALVGLLNTRSGQNINLDCFNTLLTPFKEHLKSQIQAAMTLYKQTQNQSEEDRTAFLNSLKGYFLNEKGSYEDTIAYKAYLELNQVLEVGLRKIREDLINAGTQMVNQGIPAGTVVQAVANGETEQQIKSAASAAAKQSAASGQQNTPMTKEQALGVRADNNPVEITYTDNNRLYKLSIPTGKTGKDVISTATEVDKDGKPIAPTTPQQESLKQKREGLLHEALFKKLVKRNG